MIIQTGMRTDIPAFYSEWLTRRFREGYVLVRNPYNPGQVTRYRLSPDVVDLVAFCSKNPGPMLKHMDVLKPFGQYWYVTITPYGRDIEPHVPPKEAVMEDFCRLSRMVGKDSMGWRYDPIIVNDTYTVEKHIRCFEQMASVLSGYTETCVISFLDLYQKVKRNYPEGREVSHTDQLILGKAMTEIGRKYGMTIRPCAEGNELAAFGADCSGCMTVPLYEKALHQKLRVPSGKTGSRTSCACLLGNDIGAYDTCGHLCRYCYANTEEKAVLFNLMNHDPNSPFLCGALKAEDVIHDADQKSWIEHQLSFDF